MKKRLVKFLLASALSLTAMVSMGTAVDAAVNVVKSFRYDHNTILNFDTNYHAYAYIEIPDNAYYHHQSKTKVGGGWNYNRYQVIKYYKGSRVAYY